MHASVLLLLLDSLSACQLSTDPVLRDVSTGTIPPDLLPEGVTVLDSEVALVGITCAACGCPESGSPIFHVRVPRTDVDRLRAAGWSIEG